MTKKLYIIPLTVEIYKLTNDLDVEDIRDTSKYDYNNFQ
jgi:hypothetical protein